MKLQRILLLSAMLLTLASCEKNPDGNAAGGLEKVVGIEDKTISADATEVTTVLFTAGGKWSTRINCSWLSATPASGEAGLASVKVTAEPNSGAKSRIGSVQFVCGSDTKTLHVTQNGSGSEPVPEPVYGPLLADGFSQDLHFSTARLRTTSAVMQSFDIAKDGETIYYTQLNNKFRVYLSWNKRNSQETPTDRCMTLCYTGHGSNFTLEEAADGKYIWMDNYSSKNASGDYWDAQIISRIPIKAGTTVKPWQATENYYFGEKNISVAVDIEGDMLTILGISSGRIRTYRLSELRALPVEEITLAPITYGGEDKADDPETTKTMVCKARDARKAKPLGDFTILREHYNDGTQVSWQGFDIHDGLIYQAQGNGHADGTPSPGWLQVRKVNGAIVVPLTTFKALEDLAALKNAGITDTGYMEPEGVKYRHGSVFCGFCSKKSDDVRRGTLFRYDPKLVK